MVGYDVFTVIEIKGEVEDTSCSWKTRKAIEMYVWWDGDGLVCRELLPLDCIEEEFHRNESGTVLRTEIL